jgi:hypothetical protein
MPEFSRWKVACVTIGSFFDETASYQAASCGHNRWLDWSDGGWNAIAPV